MKQDIEKKLMKNKIKIFAARAIFLTEHKNRPRSDKIYAGRFKFEKIYFIYLGQQKSTMFLNFLDGLETQNIKALSHDRSRCLAQKNTTCINLNNLSLLIFLDAIT